MPLSKRCLDIGLALLMMLLLAPVMGWLLFSMWRHGERPFFYVSERMKTVDEPFRLWKLRTMRPQAGQGADGVAGGDVSHRITPYGAWLRKHRLDEIPQLWNILKGDMSFVGPRPELRRYVESAPALFAEVLKSRPGVTGLATIRFHRHEEHLLARSKSPEETDAIYRRDCLPRKARLDLIYQKNRSFCFDLKLIFGSVGKLFQRGLFQQRR